MRLRKRANWPILVYRYWIDPEYQTWEQFPSPIQQEAEAMRALWNQLVGAFERRQVAYSQARMALTPEVTDARPTTPFTAGTGHKPSALTLRQIQQTFLSATQEVSKTSPVTWGNKQFVTTQFFAALARFFNKQGNPPQPRSGEFHELHFQHRFTEGGLPVERIFGHSQRLCLTNVPPDAFSPALPQRQRKHLARTSGFFQVSGSQVRFRTILHRPFPPGAYLKTAALVGKKCAQNGYHCGRTDEGHTTPARWNWSLQLTLEVPPSQLPLPHDTATAAVQVRCELVDEQRLCFGILTDATGREEALFLPEPILGSWQHKRTLQSQADHLLDRTKQQLQKLPLPVQLPLSVKQMLSHLNTAHAPGLWRLLRSLDHMGVEDEVVQILRHWAADSTKLLREAHGLERRYLGHRDWFYHNVAVQLCHRYQQLAITATELYSPAVQEKKENNTGERQGLGTYRQLAAPSRFVSFVQQAASKTGTTVTIAPRLRPVAHR